MTFVAFKEKIWKRVKGGKKNNKKNVASLGASLPIAFLKGWIIIQIELAFFSYTVQLKSFLCRIFMIIHLFLSWAESLAQEAVVQMKGIVSGKMGLWKWVYLTSHIHSNYQRIFSNLSKELRKWCNVKNQKSWVLIKVWSLSVCFCFWWNQTLPVEYVTYFR